MIRNRRLLKTFTVFFIVEISLNTIAPTISWALTAGPTAPEFSSFEPVDTTDMVNLATGEFVYNTPIIEIPGPEGGYPLSLSYHAGIKLDQEASWVGLGFTLNPGAINRSVSGYADDNYQTQNKVTDYWGGGASYTKTYNYGVTAVGVSAAYSQAETQDTYKGFSTNSSFGISVDPVNLLMSAASSFKAKSIQQEENENWDGITGAKGYGMQSTYVGGSSLGISIDSKGTKTNLTAGSENFMPSNNFAGNISSMHREIPVGQMQLSPFSYGQTNYFTRYWSDESQFLYTYGSLYPGGANDKIASDDYLDNLDLKSFTAYAFDSYNLHDDDIIESQQNIVNDHNDPQKQLGGSFPAYDQYSVLGQGIGGVMQPVIFENGDLYGQSLYERGSAGQPIVSHPVLEYKSLRKFSNKKVDFRFLNDFSNSLQITPSTFRTDENNNLIVDAHTIQANVEGFNNDELNQKLAGSKHIEWFTNEEIVNGSAQQIGFVDFYTQRSDRKLDFEIVENYLQPEEAIPYTSKVSYGSQDGQYVTGSYDDNKQIFVTAPDRYQYLRPKIVDLRKKIGGFKLTNETGVTYHYALPVYNYNEYARSTVINPRKGAPTFKESFNNDPYAYTWLLTAITGPDYVDRNNDGALDDNDWGYWVKFDYGRWADAYQWRTPHTGALRDSENENETFSYGIKELYYLDAVETRSHKAIFIKSKRKDGRGVTSRLEGGSNPRNYKLHYKNWGVAASKGGDVNFNISPVSTMKLDAIYLFNKDELATIPMNKATGEKYVKNPVPFEYKGETIVDNLGKVLIKQGEDFVTVKYHNGDLVYDDDDIHDLPVFRQKALRIIEFDTDYSLVNRTPNSLGYFSDLPNRECSPMANQVVTPLQKRIGLDFEWPESFGNHCVDNFLGQDPHCYADDELFYSQKGIFGRYVDDASNECSDALSPVAGNPIEYPLVGKLTLNGLKFLGHGGADLIPPTTFKYDQNFGYSLLYFDEWGYYKSDAGDNTHTKRITEQSSTFVNAWSLKSVTSPLGVKFEIEYEPNQYQKSVYNDFSVFGIKDIKTFDDNNVEVFFKEQGLDLSQWFKVGESINMASIIVYNLTLADDPDLNSWLESLKEYIMFNNLVSTLKKRDKNANGIDYYFKAASQIFESNAMEPVVDIHNNSNSIVIKSEKLKELLTRKVFPKDVNIGGGETTDKEYNCTSYFLGGFIKANDPPKKYAGGIRVRSISILDTNLRKNQTVYEYISPVDGECSGITSFKPFDQPNCQFKSDVSFFDAIFTEELVKKEREKLLVYQSNFQELMNATYAKILSFNREIPAPGSLYEYVTVRNFVDDTELESHTTYHFKVFDETMVERTNQTTSTDNLDERTITIKNTAIDVGNLLEVNTYNNQNILLKSRKYNYLFDDAVEPFEQAALDSKQGVIEQSFHKHVSLYNYDATDDFYSWADKNFNIRNSPQRTFKLLFSVDKALITKRQDRSNTITSIKEVDYKLGTSTETKNYAFDFITGKVLKSISTDSYGNSYMSVSEPARKYYPNMGLKIFNPLNAHMLTQTAATYSYKINDAYEPVGLLGASIQTWSDQTPVLSLTAPQQNVWRQGTSYQWNGQQALNSDGTFQISEFNQHLFANWNNVPDDQDQTWMTTGVPTLYDGYSHSLEAKDINENYAAVRMDPKQQRVLVSGSNAKYNEIIFAGVESYEGNSELQGSAGQGDGSASSAQKHTGQYSLLVDAGKTGFTYTLTPGKADLTKKYRASVWVYAPGDAETQPQLDQLQLYYSINTQLQHAVHPVLQKSKSKSWYLLSLDIVPNGTDAVLIGVNNNTQRGVYFDDFRVQPLTSTLTSYVYDPSTNQVNFVLDANNFYTHFEYDAMGRLIRTSKELLNFDFGDGKESTRVDAVLKEVKYNYGKSN